MDPKKNAPKLDVDYFAFEGNDFYEWVDTAPTSNLVEATRSGIYLSGHFPSSYLSGVAVHRDITEQPQDKYYTKFIDLEEVNRIRTHVEHWLYC